MESGKCIELDAPGATCTITLTSAEMEPADRAGQLCRCWTIWATLSGVPAIPHPREAHIQADDVLG